MNSKRYSFYAVVAILSALSAMATAAEPNLKGIMQGLRDDVVAIADGLLIDDLKSVANGATRIANHARIPAEQVQLVAAELGSDRSGRGKRRSRGGDCRLPKHDVRMPGLSCGLQGTGGRRAQRAR